jgi:hypothetical protein
MGIRNIKFYPDANSTSRNQNNDAPVFRYSDVLLMKAEAILRGGTPTNGHTALSLVNMVRSNRSTSPEWTSVTLDDLYAERAREFTWECWRRNDMIRFGKYENSYGFKTMPILIAAFSLSLPMLLPPTTNSFKIQAISLAVFLYKQPRGFPASGFF